MATDQVQEQEDVNMLEDDKASVGSDNDQDLEEDQRSEEGQDDEADRT